MTLAEKQRTFAKLVGELIISTKEIAVPAPVSGGKTQ